VIRHCTVSSKYTGPRIKIHPRGQPAHLSPKFANHAADEKSMADEPLKPLGVGPSAIVMYGIIVPGEIPEGQGFCFCEFSCVGEFVVYLKTVYGFFRIGFAMISIEHSFRLITQFSVVIDL